MTDEQQPVFRTVGRLDFSILPIDHSEYRYFNVSVEYRRPGRYAVCWQNECYSTAGKWEYEPMNSSKTEQWRNEHYYSLAGAQEVAKRVCPTLMDMGRSVQDVLADSKPVRIKEM